MAILGGCSAAARCEHDWRDRAWSGPRDAPGAALGIEFAYPLLLLLLVPCLALVVGLWRSSRAYLPPVRRAAALGLRTAIVTLVGLALAGPVVRLGANQLALAILLDRSDSITPPRKTSKSNG